MISMQVIIGMSILIAGLVGYIAIKKFGVSDEIFQEMWKNAKR